MYVEGVMLSHIVKVVRALVSFAVSLWNTGIHTTNEYRPNERPIQVDHATGATPKSTTGGTVHMGREGQRAVAGEVVRYGSREREDGEVDVHVEPRGRGCPSGCRVPWHRTADWWLSYSYPTMRSPHARDLRTLPRDATPGRSK